MPMPRKMSGSAISRIDELIVAISIPSVVFESATHLYSTCPRAAAAGSAAAPSWRFLLILPTSRSPLAPGGLRTPRLRQQNLT